MGRNKDGRLLQNSRWQGFAVPTMDDIGNCQACKLKIRLIDLTSCLCSAAALAVCFKGRVAGVDAMETGNEFSQLKS